MFRACAGGPSAMRSTAEEEAPGNVDWTQAGHTQKNDSVARCLALMALQIGR